MTNKFAKKIIFTGISILSVIPIVTFVSCSSQNPLEQLLEDEINKNRKLRQVEGGVSIEKINLLNVGEDNEQLSNIFELPSIVELPSIKLNEKNTIKYSWDFTKKNIVSFDKSGNIKFEANASIFSSANPLDTITKPVSFTIFIEETTIKENTLNLKAFRYVYYGDDEKRIEFEPVRSDIFEKSKEFNIDFYSNNSLINNRPVIIEKGASSESAMDAYLSKGMIKPPLSTLYNETRYRFNISSSDFNESNSRKGIYKIRVSPEIDSVFDYDVINYAKDTYGISFDKYYYYYEKNTTFQDPTSSNVSTHNNNNSQEANRIGDSILQGNLSYMPTLKNPESIINKTAEEIVKLNLETPGGLFLPPIFERQYSIEPPKPVMIDIDSISALDNENLTFSITVKVGNNSFQMTKKVDKKVEIKYFFVLW